MFEIIGAIFSIIPAYLAFTSNPAYPVEGFIWIGVVLVTFWSGAMFVATANRITRLEEQMKTQVPAVSNNELLDKLNALDPQSRRVVESVIDAESKRSAE